jgi:competence protein ComEC
VVILYRLPQLPNSGWLWLLPLLLLSSWRCGAVVRFASLLLAGLLWAQLHAGWSLEQRLTGDKRLEVEVEGVVASIPQADGRRLRLLFEPDSDHSPALPPRVRINWYDPPATGRPALAERWRMVLSLRRPHGMVNPGGFDYEGWLFGEGIGATGYIRSGERLAPADPASIGWWRQRIHDQIGLALSEDPLAGVVRALAVGERGGIDDDQWRIFLRTGTNHLVAISGLHIGLMAGFGYLVAGWLWSRSTTALRWLERPRAAALGAILLAIFYAALAGFSIPTRRAAVMVVVAMAAVWWYRSIPSSRLLALALVAVLLLDPVAVLAPGFWLSFAAVAVLIHAIQPPRHQQLGAWGRWGRAQWVIAIGLAPLLISSFGKLSLVAPLANLVAVPWVGLLVVPLALAGSLCSLLFEPVGSAMLQLASHLLAELWLLLVPLASLPLAELYRPALPLWTLLLALPGVVLLSAPAAVPLRWSGLAMVLPLATWQPEPLPYGTFRYTQFDVGQGSAALIETAAHALLYDAGPRYPGGFDSGESIVLPALRRLGIERVDRLLISHPASDHAGGVDAIQAALEVDLIMAPDRRGEGQCHDGLAWEWDGVGFMLLHPPRDEPGESNDHSCQLMVTNRFGTILLTGDLEEAGESSLVSRYTGQLQVDLLQVPHHGSRTSSSSLLLDETRPRLAVIAVGWGNRYRFPHPLVVDRYRQLGATVLTTAESGAISLIYDRPEPEPQFGRLLEPRLWRE